MNMTVQSVTADISTFAVQSKRVLVYLVYLRYGDAFLLR